MIAFNIIARRKVYRKYVGVISLLINLVLACWWIYEY